MKKKIKLTDLKVQSFVTALTEEEKHIARGGDYLDEVMAGIPQTFSICGFTICQMGTVCTQVVETRLYTCIYCKPKV